MKKKIISILLASTIAVTALGLTACKEDKDDGDDGVLRSEKVASAEAWAAAFDFSEVTNFSSNFNGIVDGKTRVSTTKRDGNKMMYIYASGEYNGKDYSEYRPDELTQDYDGEMYGTRYDYEYDNDTQKWKLSNKYASQWGFSQTIMKMVRDSFDDYSACSHIAESYSDFTYDDENYEYVAIYDNVKWNDNYCSLTYEKCKVTVKIKNGKLAEGTCSTTYRWEYKDGRVEVEDRSMTLKGYDFGTTVITRPNIEE